MRTLRDRIVATISSWPFLLCVAVLLANDMVLKAAHPGYLTGKLSDFAGVAIVGLLLFSVFPGRPVPIFAGIAVAFLWWKSPLSSPFLQWVNGLGFGVFGRTVDYSDLWALSVLPVCESCARLANRLSPSWKRLRAILALPVGAITLLAILGTSQIPFRHENFLIRDTSSGNLLEREPVVAVIKGVAEKHRMSCQNCDRAPGSFFYGDRFGMKYEFTGPNTVTFEIWIETSCTLIFFFCSDASASKKAEALRKSLKQELGTRFRDLEYVERLPSTTR